MKDWWMKFGCFLTGFNYSLIRNSSEVSARIVKQYTSALLIIIILWGSIGYAFTSRYIFRNENCDASPSIDKTLNRDTTSKKIYVSISNVFLSPLQSDDKKSNSRNVFYAILSAVFLVIIVIQIERQIILSQHKNKMVFGARIIIACCMACIGSVIIDQVIFAEDIEKQRSIDLIDQVDSLYDVKTKDFSKRISDIEKYIQTKEIERTNIIEEITKHPGINYISYKSKTTSDTLPAEKTYTVESKPNPKAGLINSIDASINKYQDTKTKLEDERANAKTNLERDLRSRIGFLDELKYLFRVLNASTIAMVVWIIFFVVLFLIEFLVVISKLSGANYDYERAVAFQNEIRIALLEKHSKETSTLR